MSALEVSGKLDSQSPPAVPPPTDSMGKNAASSIEDTPVIPFQRATASNTTNVIRCGDEDDGSSDDEATALAEQKLLLLCRTLSDHLTNYRGQESFTDEIWDMLEQFQDALSSEDSRPDAEMLRFMGSFLFQQLGTAEVAALFFEAAVELYPTDCTSLLVFGNFMDQVLQKSAAAEELYRRCLSLEPAHPDAAQNLGAVLIERAKLPTRSSSQRRDLFAQARDLLTKVDRTSPGFTAYNLACVAALTDNAAECERWLRHAAKFGTLPSPDTLRSDPDLMSVSTLPIHATWFADVLNTAQELQATRELQAA